MYIVQVWNGRKWAKRRDIDATPVRGRAERAAEACERAPRRESSSDGLPHRVVEQVTRGWKGEVRGMPVKTTSPRRYLVVRVRPQDDYVPGWQDPYFPKFAEIVLRTDNIRTARSKARQIGYSLTTGHRVPVFAVVIDTVTGQEVT